MLDGFVNVSSYLNDLSNFFIKEIKTCLNEFLIKINSMSYNFIFITLTKVIYLIFHAIILKKIITFSLNKFKLG